VLPSLMTSYNVLQTLPVCVNGPLPAWSPQQGRHHQIREQQGEVTAADVRGA
jgi:hypothetical protein